jgi:hypothetical protein
MTTSFGYKKCKNAFEGLGLKLPKISKKTMEKRVGDTDLECIVSFHDISLIFINDYNFTAENCREELMNMANGVIAENHIIRTDYGLNDFLEENKIISPFRISFISTKGLSCCKAIKEMNEIETKQKAKSKTEAVYYGAEDNEGVVDDIFYITLSNFWLKSTVHFTFALSLLRQDFWNKEKEIREAMKFAFGKGKDIFENKNLNWSRCTKKTYDHCLWDIFYDSFDYLGCLTFSKVYKKVIEKGYFEESYFGVGNKHSVSKHLLKTSFYKRLAEKFAVKQVKKVKKAKKVA